MPTVTIKIDQSGLGAGTAGVSRDDLVTGTAVVCTVPSHPGAASYAWVLSEKPAGSASALSGGTTATAQFTPDVEGTYLVELHVDADYSYTTNAIGYHVSTQGGCGVKSAAGFRAPGAGETTQFGATGWRGALSNIIAAVSARLPSTNQKTDLGQLDSAPQGTIWYANASGRVTRLAPGAAGRVLQTNGAGANPTWVVPSGGGGGDGRVSVADYGAVGDGVADDRAAIEAALAYALSSGIMHVYCPPGTYLISQQTTDLRCGLDLLGYSGMTISGAGNMSILKMAARTSQGGDQFATGWRGLIRGRASDITLRDIQLNGSWDGVTGYEEQIHLLEIASPGTVRGVVASDPNGISAVVTLGTAGHYTRFPAGTMVQFYADDGGNPTGYPIVQKTGVLTLTGNAVNNETVTVGPVVYTWKTVLTGAANEILIAGSASASIDNLIAAIMAGAGVGTTYGTGTVANPKVGAYVGAGDTMIVRAWDQWSSLALNSMATTETMTNGSWGHTELTGGPYEVASSVSGSVTFTTPVSVDIATSMHMGYADFDSQRWQLLNVEFRDSAGDGLRMQGEGLYRVAHVTANNCKMVNCKRTSANFQRNVEHVTISNSYMENVTDACVEFETSPADNAYAPRYITVDKCQIVRKGGSGVNQLFQLAGLAADRRATDLKLTNNTLIDGGMQILRCRNVMITGTRIVSRSDVQCTESALDITGSDNVYVGGSTIIMSAGATPSAAITIAVDSAGSTGCDGVVIEGCTVEQYTDAVPIAVNAATNVRVGGNRISNLSSTTTTAGINFRATTAGTYTNLIVENNTIIGNAGGGALTYGVQFQATVASGIIGRTVVTGNLGTGFGYGAKYIVNSGSFSAQPVIGLNGWTPTTGAFDLTAGTGLTHAVVAGSAGGLEMFTGAGAPSFTATKGSIFTRTDGTAGALGIAGTLRYINTDGATTWQAMIDG